MAVAQARHDVLVRGALTARGGRISSTMGDGLRAAFASASVALEVALQLQSGTAREPWPMLPSSASVRTARRFCLAGLRDGSVTGRWCGERVAVGSVSSTGYWGWPGWAGPMR